MDHSSEYKDYVSGGYLEYQKKYEKAPRESDRILLELVRGAVAERSRGGAPVSLLDIGCSNGNFLRLVKREHPNLVLEGGELYGEILETCRQDPSLEGIRFAQMDVRALGRPAAFDVIVANALLSILDDDSFAKAIVSLGQSLKPGGQLFTFDWFHAYEQDIAIFEKERDHPEGITLHFRPMTPVRARFVAAGFDVVDFRPFRIPIDLPKPADPGDVTTHTVRMESGERLLFRGAICQPWCHLVARRKA